MTIVYVGSDGRVQPPFSRPAGRITPDFPNRRALRDALDLGIPIRVTVLALGHAIAVPDGVWDVAGGEPVWFSRVVVRGGLIVKQIL